MCWLLVDGTLVDTMAGGGLIKGMPAGRVVETTCLVGVEGVVVNRSRSEEVEEEGVGGLRGLVKLGYPWGAAVVGVGRTSGGLPCLIIL